jgi:hypothetical protein
MLDTRWWLALLLVFPACAGGQDTDATTPEESAGESESADEATAPPAQAVAPAPEPMARYEGRYELLNADRDINECPVELSVGVTEIVVSREPPILHTVGENRDYPARVEDDAIIGEARFPSEIGSDDACPDSTIFERWRLTLGDDNSLSGVHEAIWLFPPNCSRPCRVSFNVTTGPRNVTGIRDSI